MLNSCKVSQNNRHKNETVDYTGPSTLVYKTKKDYYSNVSVILSDDKARIVNYPAVTDVYYKGILAYPVKLKKGYLLDNRGIGKNVAFLKYTYEEYSKLKETPSPEDLYKSIIDKSPLSRLYNCGNRYRFRSEVDELNDIIETKKLKNFIRLK